MSHTEESVIRWCIVTADRVGMIRDIVDAIAVKDGNVEAMEVVARILFVRFRIHHHTLNNLRQAVAGIPGVTSIEPVSKLPFEEDEARLVRRVMQQENAHTAASLSFSNFVAHSRVMLNLLATAKSAANSDLPVLVYGESGTGKELLARAIHEASSRSGRRFIPVNCAAIPDALMESEMFGYSEGAFTGALKGGRPGLFEVADSGTLFLDEIGEMSLSLQAKLLRVLADGEIRRVGAASTAHVNTRVIAATNRNLNDLVHERQFREDLLYRLNVMPLYLPPLRERREDILPLAHHFLQRIGRKLERTFELNQDAEEQLLAYDFPGNVRELQNIVERASYLVQGDGDIIRAEQLLLQPTRRIPTPAQSAGTLKEMVRIYERQLIQRAVEQYGSLRAAAKVLGVTHTTLTNKLSSDEKS